MGTPRRNHRRTARRRIVTMSALFALAFGALAACGDDDGSASNGDAATTSTSAAEDEMDDAAAPRSADEQAEIAIEDLAAELDVDASEIAVVSADLVTWSDSSLGCPEEGSMYAQVLTDGTRVVLEADGEEYTYHSAADADPFLCEDPQEPNSVG